MTTTSGTGTGDSPRVGGYKLNTHDISSSVSRPVSVPRARLTTVAWLAHTGLTLQEWEGQGQRLGLASRSTNWWLGDWLRFGMARFGQRYRTAAEATGYDEQTLMNMSYVASRFAPSRRREGLSWSHHAELAALDEAEQDAWLDRAASGGLSVRRLRTALKHSQAAALPARDDRQLPGAVAARCPHCGYWLGGRDEVGRGSVK